MKKALIFCLLAFALASAQPKQRVAVLPSVGELSPQELELLTVKVREIATKTLPVSGFLLLRQEAVISAIGGEEEFFRECKEGTCVGELAKKANANYGARCDVLKVGKDLVLKFELYSVKDEAILETFTDYNAKDFRGMIAALEQQLPGAFRKCLEISTTLISAVGTETEQYSVSTLTNVTFVDLRDSKEYKTVKIGSQIWMAENLNYGASGSKCYDNKTENCDKYGRLYDWNTAKTACPSGWHLPSDSEWTKLTDYVGSKTAKQLKAKSGWSDGDNGSDVHGFSALPGGYGYSGGYFYNDVGIYGRWWSSTEYTAYGACGGIIFCIYEGVRRYNDKPYLFSVRCLQD
jgi:uncharacterized protein (TIGR02145 family)